MNIEIPNFVFALREDLKDRIEFLPERSDPSPVPERKGADCG